MEIRRGWIEVGVRNERGKWKRGQGQMRGTRVWTVVGFGEFWVMQEKVFGGMGPRESNGEQVA